MTQYIESNTALFFFNLKHAMQKMSSELQEHRNLIELNVACRTALLNKRIDVPEVCNTTLCSKLALSQKIISSQKYGKKFVDAALTASRCKGLSHQYAD